MPKRKPEQQLGADGSGDGGLRRSTRQRVAPASASTDDRIAQAAKPAKPAMKRSPKKGAALSSTKLGDNEAEDRAKGKKVARQERRQSGAATESKDKVLAAKNAPHSKPSSTKRPSKNAEGTLEVAGKEGGSVSERWYWLMKAEPETRLENGTDVKFSIDDLAARTEPEPWDGIRNYVARNNLRAMKKGEMAFFYHSNCKEPGIVGTMEIVQEHSPDLSAHDSKAPYYDASSKPDNPKWSVVHVEFRSKFAQPIGLKELREMGKLGQPLENMQMLKQSRLSVSRVTPAEWEYILGVVQERDGAASK